MAALASAAAKQQSTSIEALQTQLAAVRAEATVAATALAAANANVGAAVARSSELAAMHSVQSSSSDAEAASLRTAAAAANARVADLTAVVESNQVRPRHRAAQTALAAWHTNKLKATVFEPWSLTDYLTSYHCS